MLINKKETREFILQKCQHMRPGLGIERVSKDSLDMIELRTRNLIIDMILAHPSKGKTFKP